MSKIFKIPYIENYWEVKPNCVCPGFIPGTTTDFCAAILAEKFDGIFVNLTEVGGIYTKNPKKYSDAKLIKNISFEELEKLNIPSKPGMNFPIDQMAVKIISRSKIKTIIIKPTYKNLIDMLKGKVNGTVIS